MPVAASQDRSDPVRARNPGTCLARRDHCCARQRAPWCEGCRVRSLAPCASLSDTNGRTAPSFWVSESIVPPGDDIVEQSQSCGDFYVIIDGWAVQYELLEDGSRQILDFLPAGSIAGLQPDGNAPLAYFVQALTTVRVCSFSTAGFLRAARSNSALALWLAAAASRSHCRSLHRLTLIGRMTAKKRIAALLLELYRRGRPWSTSDHGRRDFFADDAGANRRRPRTHRHSRQSHAARASRGRCSGAEARGIENSRSRAPGRDRRLGRSPTGEPANLTPCRRLSHGPGTARYVDR